MLCSEGMTEVPGLGTRETLSQIAVENMEEPLILTYSRDISIICFGLFLCFEVRLFCQPLTILTRFTSHCLPLSLYMNLSLSFPSSLLDAHRYGRRSWSLWSTRIHWADCKEALASIRGVAQDVIARLQAEFHEEDLYLAYRAFDLDAWAKVVSASTPDDSTRPLEAVLRKMGAVLEAATD